MTLMGCLSGQKAMVSTQIYDLYIETSTGSKCRSTTYMKRNAYELCSSVELILSLLVDCEYSQEKDRRAILHQECL